VSCVDPVSSGAQVDSADAVDSGDVVGPGLRPQSLMLTFLGNYVLGRDVCIYSGSVIDVFARTGVGEHAARSTLARMVNRGLLRRQREGRKMYFGLTERSARILRDGEERIWKAGPVNRDWDGTWTLLGFSLPEAWQRQRHDLRSQLTWAGFGPLFGGVWIAPGRADMAGIVASLGLESHVKVFRSTAEPGTDVGQMIRETWELDALAARYADFTARWRPYTQGRGAVDDPLGVKLLLFTEWLQLIRADPRLPVQHLPADWPAAAAEDLFRSANSLVDEPARLMAERLLDTVPINTAATDTGPQ
jgi:phenylacetic acid degradation operon negative regulatory protein